jgi:hypothetical protein
MTFYLTRLRQLYRLGHGAARSRKEIDSARPGNYHWIEGEKMKKACVWLIVIGVLSTLASSCIVSYPTIAPPPVRVEVRPVQPGPNHIWIGGYWAWRSSKYVWVGGYWTKARPGRAWVPGHWERRGSHWVWRRGRWR